MDIIIDELCDTAEMIEKEIIKRNDCNIIDRMKYLVSKPILKSFYNGNYKLVIVYYKMSFEEKRCMMYDTLSATLYQSYKGSEYKSDMYFYRKTCQHLFPDNIMPDLYGIKYANKKKEFMNTRGLNITGKINKINNSEYEFISDFLSLLRTPINTGNVILSNTLNLSKIKELQ